MSFWLHGFCGWWEGWDPVNRFNHTSWVAIVTPADRPKSVRNRCVIEVFGGVLCVFTLLFGFFCRCKGFCHRAESDLFLFSYGRRRDKWRNLTQCFDKRALHSQKSKKHHDNVKYATKIFDYTMITNLPLRKRTIPKYMWHILEIYCTYM